MTLRLFSVSIVFGIECTQPEVKTMTQRHMEDGQLYKLTPPSQIKGQKFSEVYCEYQVPANPNEYVVRGIPEDGDKEDFFLLIFTDKGVSVTPIETSSQTPNLKAV